MVTKKRVFSVLALLVFLAIVILFVLGKINTNLNIISEILSGSLTGIIILVFGFIIIVVIIRFFRVSIGRGARNY